MIGAKRLPIFNAFREKYACGVISPIIVIAIVENKKAPTPVNTESDNMVNKTLMPTLPHKIVDKRKFESSLSLSTFCAALLSFFTSTSK